MAWVVVGFHCKAAAESPTFHSTEAHVYLRTTENLTAFESSLPHIGNGGGASAGYAFAFRFATVPIRIAMVCRDIHALLTGPGPKARPHDDIDEDKLLRVWVTLDECWTSLDDLRNGGAYGIVQLEDIERFIDGWQVRYDRRYPNLDLLTDVSRHPQDLSLRVPYVCAPT